MTFQLDTSGAVDGPEGDLEDFYRWNDLTPFTQGYVEAALRAYSDRLTTGLGEPLHVGYSDLAPETLARIIEDCTTFLEWNRLAGTRCFVADGMTARGRSWWGERNRGLDAPRWPPLTLTLGDDGKVRFA